MALYKLKQAKGGKGGILSSLKSIMMNGSFYHPQVNVIMCQIDSLWIEFIWGTSLPVLCNRELVMVYNVKKSGLALQKIWHRCTAPVQTQEHGLFQMYSTSTNTGTWPLSDLQHQYKHRNMTSFRSNCRVLWIPRVPVPEEKHVIRIEAVDHATLLL